MRKISRSAPVLVKMARPALLSGKVRAVKNTHRPETLHKSCLHKLPQLIDGVLRVHLSCTIQRCSLVVLEASGATRA